MDAKDKYELRSGDVVVWGGEDRLRYHSIDRLIGDREHQILGPCRYNLTSGKAS